MANYPNMSHCMNENTLAALQQVLTAMDEEGPEFLSGLSASEKRAYTELFNACEAFIDIANLIQGNNEPDGQPDEAQEWESFDPDC